MAGSMIDDVMASFESASDARDFVEAQHRTIVELTKRLDKVTNEKKQLEQLLQSTSPALIGEYKPVVQPFNTVDQALEENICRMELKKLHDVSLERVLTHEEAKKVEIYTKLLVTLAQKVPTKTLEMRKLSTEELLDRVSSEKPDDPAKVN